MQIDFSTLRGLANESPSTLMGCVRVAWPYIEAARKRRVSLKVIHEHLNKVGIPISYRLPSVYVNRLQDGPSEAEAVENSTNPESVSELRVEGHQSGTKN